MAGVSAKLVKELRDRTGLGMLECKKALAENDGDIEKAIEELRKSSGMKAAKKAGRTAADGVVVARVADDNSYGIIVEINSETDFVARDEGFLAFASQVADAVFAAKTEDVASLMAGELESAREALVQKIGENIGVRRAVVVEGENVDAYVHSNNRIAALVALNGANAEAAKDVAMHVTAVNPQVVSKDDMPEEVINKEKEIIMAQPDMASKPAEIAEKMVVGRINKFLAENSLVEQQFVKNPDQKVGEMVKAAGGSVASFARLEVGEGIEVEQVDFAAEVAAQLNG
ncbi:MULTISPECIES: translation elongation factor Ts [Neptunomonas]|uniref:Elongation factor Ts n=1 Tax=Neptunomonas marina TaxID=1815562 RepID=A0A437Q6Q3_9GAMM|nr:MULTISPECIES: translation elongation factor Ts [Neptunomonas]RVU30194.1 elongation factor Ts [Neptunomonas marina]